MDDLVLIDAYSQIFRCFYAIRTRLTNPKGECVTAVYGMAKLLMDLEVTHPSPFGAICFDLGKSSRRTALLPEYKAQRPPMPEDLRCQIEPIHQWMAAFGWSVLQKEGIEADDLIAAVTRSMPGKQVRIVTHDKDLGQLIDNAEKVKLLFPAPKGGWQEIGVAEIQEKFGVGPDKLGDYLALVGDTVDNIRGLEGVGPKTAASLLNAYGSLDGILAHTGELKAGRVRTALESSGEQLKRNRQLVELYSDLPDGWKGEASVCRKAPDWNRIYSLAEAEGFSSLLKAIDSHRPKSGQLEFNLF